MSGSARRARTRAGATGSAARLVVSGLLAVMVAVAGSLVFGSPAAAHVTARADEAVPGSMTRVVFRVPNETSSDPTTELEVHLSPEGAPPIPSAWTTPMPGWSVEVEREEVDEPTVGAHGEQINEAVTVIRWTVEDPEAAIEPGEFGEFVVEIGPLPDVPELYFPTLQTYEGLDEPVRWIAPPDPDGGAAENPAPVLQLDAAPPDEDGSGGSEQADATGEASSDEDASSAGVWLGLAGLVAGLAGLLLGGVAFLRTRSQ